MSTKHCIAISLAAGSFFLFAAEKPKKPAVAAHPGPKLPAVPPMSSRPRPWSLQPVARPALPANGANPIDAFIGAMYAE